MAQVPFPQGHPCQAQDRVRLSTRRRVVLLGGVIALGALGLSACSNKPPECDKTLPNYGAPAARARETSVNLEFSIGYMTRKIRAGIETPTKDSGVHVREVAFGQRSEGGELLNVVSLRIAPWKRINGRESEVKSGPYDLQLKLTPYIVNQTTVPDAAQRRAIFGSTDEGAAFRFELLRLINTSNNKEVSCSSEKLGPIESRVLGGILQGLIDQQPLAVPANTLVGLVAKIIGVDPSSPEAPKLKGLNLSFGGGTKLGFLLGDSGKPFHPRAELVGRESDHWGVEIDTQLLRTAITRMVVQSIHEQTASSRVSDVRVLFLRPSIEVDTVVHHAFCNPFRYEIDISLKPRISLAPNGEPILQISPTTKAKFANGVQALCVGIGNITAGIGLPPEDPPPCAHVVGDPIRIVVAPGPEADVLYPTNTYTNDVFYIGGRSTAMDRWIGTTGPTLPVPLPPC